MMDERLKELSDDLASASVERNRAQAALELARRTEVYAKQAIRNHMQATYGVDAWRL